jgi:16S rRNA (guanine527-N7)-methyltransferase
VASVADRRELEGILFDGLKGLGLQVADASLPRLLDYIDLLERWNATYNLTAVRDRAQMVTRHLLDSLSVAPFVVGDSLADLGSGAGLPGIPLALLAPQRKVVLVDTNGKKARFMREAVRMLRLDNVRVEQARVQDVAGEFACITTRAFASLKEMLVWGGHLLARDGIWLALKGRLPNNEIDDLPPGFTVTATRMLQVPGLDAERHLVIISKTPTHAAAGQ